MRRTASADGCGRSLPEIKGTQTDGRKGAAGRCPDKRLRGDKSQTITPSTHVIESKYQRKTRRVDGEMDRTQWKGSLSGFFVPNFKLANVFI